MRIWRDAPGDCTFFHPTTFSQAKSHENPDNFASVLPRSHPPHQDLTHGAGCDCQQGSGTARAPLAAGRGTTTSCCSS